MQTCFSRSISIIKRISAVAPIAILAVASSAQAASVNFTDNFSPASSLWNNAEGNWTSSGGKYYAQMANNNPGAISALPYDMTNYTVTVTANALGDSGIYLRSDGTSNNVGRVVLILGGAGYGQGSRGGNAGTELYFYSTAYGDQQAPVYGVFTPGDNYTIKVTAIGDTYSVYLNGSSTAIDTFVDSADPTHGKVGLYDDQPNVTTGSGFGTPSSFSNFSLVGTDTATAPSAAPEPASTALLAIGLAGLGAWYRRRRA